MEMEVLPFAGLFYLALVRSIEVYLIADTAWYVVLFWLILALAAISKSTKSIAGVELAGLNRLLELPIA
jgi:hypothetical protein